MLINIDYSKRKISKFDLNLVLFCNDKLNVGNIKKYLTIKPVKWIEEALSIALAEPLVPLDGSDNDSMPATRAKKKTKAKSTKRAH